MTKDKEIKPEEKKEEGIKEKEISKDEKEIQTLITEVKPEEKGIQTDEVEEKKVKKKVRSKEKDKSKKCKKKDKELIHGYERIFFHLIINFFSSKTFKLLLIELINISFIIIIIYFKIYKYKKVIYFTLYKLILDI